MVKAVRANVRDAHGSNKPPQTPRESVSNKSSPSAYRSTVVPHRPWGPRPIPPSIRDKSARTTITTGGKMVKAARANINPHPRRSRQQQAASNTASAPPFNPRLPEGPSRAQPLPWGSREGKGELGTPRRKSRRKIVSDGRRWRRWAGGGRRHARPPLPRKVGGSGWGRGLAWPRRAPTSVPTCPRHAQGRGALPP